MAEKKKAFSIADYVKPEDVSNLDRVEIDKIVGISIGEIAENEKNFYDTSNVSELINSIALNGLLEPILVMPAEGEKKYKIISGHRRFKAYSQLHEENPEKYAEIPAIIKSPKNEVVEELLLIEANRATRVMSSADTMKQAERYKELLAGLKESGVEIPGRLRDIVADAMQVSASRLARLGVIRKGLCGEAMTLFEQGVLNESCAYTLAQAPAEAQEKVISGAKEPAMLSEWEIKDRIRYFDNLSKIKCRDGSACANRDRMFAEQCKDANMYSSLECTQRGICCEKCFKLCTCKAACPMFADKIKKQKAKEKAEKEQAKSDAETAALNRIAEYNKQWLREGFARERAGVSCDQVREALNDAHCYSCYPYNDQTVEKYESGDCDDSYYANFLRITGYGIAVLAKLYGCSSDYLLGLSDNPEICASARNLREEAK